MSAITGVYLRNGATVDERALGRMTARLAHRGPDGEGLWTRGPVGLGHRVLHLTAESGREVLPLSADGGALCLTADARIDNREELVRALGLRGEAAGDARLILLGYQRWGDACLDRLVGDFAFALWDGRRRLLFCARDPAGTRPFYYHASPGRFVFASEIKALLQLPEVPRRLNEQRVAEFLSETFSEKTGTFYRDILRLPAGCLLHVDERALRMRTYWSPDRAAGTARREPAESVEQFRHLFTEAVRARLRTIHPVGAMLSGGLDSSSVVSVAAQLSTGPPLQTFSAVYPHLPACDESPYIRAVVGHSRVRAHLVTPSAAPPLAELDYALLGQDEPEYWPTWPMERALFGEIREQQVRVVLDGHGGDHVLLTYPSGELLDLLRQGRWRSLRRELAARGGEGAEAALRLLWKDALRPALRAYLGPALTQVRKHLLAGPRAFPGREINPELARRLDFRDQMAALRTESLRAAQSTRRFHAYLLTHGQTSYNLERLDQATLAFSFRFRHPFWDRRLVEFCYGLPLEQLARAGETRRVLRAAMEGILAEEVRTRRSKAHFDPLLNHALFEYGRPVLEATLSRCRELLAPWVNETELQAALQRFRSWKREEVAGFDSSRDARFLVAAATLALWLERTRLHPV